MSDSNEKTPQEDPRSRFRRLLSEAEEAGAVEDGQTRPIIPGQPSGSGAAPERHPTGEPDQTGGWYAQDEVESTPGDEAPASEDSSPPVQPPTTPSVPPSQKSDDRQKPVEFVSLRSQLVDVSGKPEAPQTPHTVPLRSTNPSDTVSTQPGKTPPSQTGSTRSSTPDGEKTPPTPTRPPSRLSNPALDSQSMPLPRRVDEIDMDATRVTPAAYTPPRRPRPASGTSSTPVGSAVTRPAPSSGRPLTGRPVPTNTIQVPTLPPAKSLPRVNWRQGLGCLLRMVILALFGLIVLLVLGGTFVLYKYYQVASTIPSVDDLRQRASQFETTRIVDSKGNVLYEILEPTAGRRTYITLDKISPYVVAATVATEDKNFYSHPGFDPTAILRAFWQNFQSGGETVSGASTITQQLARALFMTADERSQRSYDRKVREALVAAEITRRYTKDEILELYLNEFNYGNMAYGIQAAAETYFGTTATNLTMGQAAFLAGLPQAPAVYDVYNNREVAMKRSEQVLRLMLETSAEQGCIYVSNNPQSVCVNTDNALAAYYEIYNYEFRSPEIQMRHPHWVNYIRSLLESTYDAQTLYREGFTVYTTLDPVMQEAAEAMVRRQVDTLVNRNAFSGALVAIRPTTGEILAMVGSADFYSESISGQVNMAISPRQPGSSIKPLTYLAAFEKGWTPATLIWDVPSEFPPSGDPNDPRPPYIPVNYDERFHGPVTVRAALANSYNIPAVKALQYVGIYDNANIPGEDGLLALARRLGITSLTSDQYGLSLTLGGGDVSLLELTSAYATLANGGMRLPHYGITRIVDYRGNVVYEYQPPPGQQVVRPEHAFLITSILADNEARSPAFGPNSVLALPFLAAAKTGTTNDFRDNWTLGYTPDLAVGVWVGNADYTPMQNTTGLTGAAPIWAEYMQYGIQTLTGGNLRPFVKPAGVIDRVICSLSGSEPSQWCPNQRGEFFAADQPPLPREFDLWTRVWFDTWTGLRASGACDKFIKEESAVNVTDPWAIRWIQNSSDGQNWARSMGFEEPLRFVPERECRADDLRPVIDIASPSDGALIQTNPLDIMARVYASSDSDFRGFRLDYSVGGEPLQYQYLMESNQQYKNTDKIYTWDLTSIPVGPITLRLRMESTRNTYAELVWHLNMNVPTPTPTPTLTPTVTPTPTLTPTVTPTLFPPTATPTPTNTDIPPTPTQTSTTAP